MRQTTGYAYSKGKQGMHTIKSGPTKNMGIGIYTIYIYAQFWRAKSRSKRFLNSFYPEAVRLLNN